MKKEDVDRRQFVVRGCACAGFLAADLASLGAATEDAAPSKPGLVGPVNGDQVIAVLNDVDRSGDGALVDAVFTRWGYQCFHSRPGLKAFAERQRLDFRGYLDYVNSGRARYWERLEYDEARGVLKMTGRKTGRCACPYAQCERPAKALCTRCCKAFQMEFFRCVTGRQVRDIHIDEAVLLGGERCSTTTYLSPE
jgi:hypothetical protein